MTLFLATAAIFTAAAIYWYVNRHKPIKYIVSELRYTLDMQGAGAGGLIDDWISVWRNKVTLPDAKNRVAVVTGGTRGIGTEVIRGMLNANMVVIMGVRNTEAAKKLANTMHNGNRLHAFQLDLKSLISVKQFAENVVKEFPEIHILVNNAGIMFGDFQLTEDGFESQLAVNYLGHFYLTHLLLPALKTAGTLEEPSRIVNVTSCGHFPGRIYFDDINMKEHYDTTAAYAQSKLAQLMTARYVNCLLEDKDIPVKCYSVHPGIVDTDLFANSNFGKLPWARRLFFKTPEKGAVSILYACFDKEILKKGGMYISNCKEGFSNRFSKNEKHQKKLFELSCDLIGIETHKYGTN